MGVKLYSLRSWWNYFACNFIMESIVRSIFVWSSGFLLLTCNLYLCIFSSLPSGAVNNEILSLGGENSGRRVLASSFYLIIIYRVFTVWECSHGLMVQEWESIISSHPELSMTGHVSSSSLNIIYCDFFSEET